MSVSRDRPRHIAYDLPFQFFNLPIQFLEVLQSAILCSQTEIFPAGTTAGAVLSLRMVSGRR